MSDRGRSHDPLVEELERMRERVKELEAVDAERKKAEHALRQSEERFRALIESSFDFTIILNAQGNITYISPNIADMWGRGAEHILGQDMYKYIHPDDIRPISDNFVRLLKRPQEPMRMEIRAQHADGTWRMLEVVAHNQIKNPAVGGIVTNFRDVTERRKAEDELQKSEQKYRSLVENTGAVIFSIDTQGKITYISPIIEQLSGYTPGEVVGTKFTQYIAKEDVPGLLASMKQTLSGKVEAYEFRVLCKDGDIRHCMSSSNVVLEDDEPTGLMGVITDITARKKAEQALLASEIKYRNLFNNAQTGLFRTRISDGKVLDCNDMFAHLTGFSTREECVSGGVSSQHYVNPADRERIVSEMKEKGYVRDVEVETTRRDGSRIWVRYSAYIYPKSGYIEGAVIDITERKKAEQALSDSSQQWQTTFDAASDAICLLDTDQRIQRCNRAMAEMFNVTEKEIIGRHCWEVVHGTSEPIPGCPITQIKTSLHREEMELHREGRWFNVAADPILGENREIRGIVHVVRDITASKKAQEELQRREHYFRSLIENSADGIMVMNRDGTTRYESPGCLRQVGYTAEERVGHSVFELMHPDDIQAAGDALKQVLSGLPAHAELRARHKDGSWRTIEVTLSNMLDDPAVGGIVVNMRDITSRRQAEATLRESEEKLRVLFKMVGVGITVTDITGRIIDVNDSLLELSGFSSKEEVIGRNGLEFISEKDRDRAIQALGNVRATGKGNPIELVLLRKDGTEYLCETDTTVVFDAYGNPAGLIIVQRDITERKRAEELIKLQRDLAQTLSAVPELREGLNHCLDVAISASGMDCGGIYIVDDETGVLTLASHAGLSQAFVKVASYYETDHPSAKLVKAGKPIYIIYQELQVPKDDIRMREGLRAMAVVPFLHEGHVVGCLNIASCKTDEVSQHARDVLEMIAGQIGGAIARMQTRQKLRESEEKYAMLVENATDGVSIIQDQVIKFANKRMSEMSGYTVQELTGMSTLDLVPPDFIPVLKERFAQREQNHAVSETFHTRMLCKDGTVKEIENSTRLIQYEGKPATLGISREITERKRMEDALRQSEEKNRALIENIRDAIFIIKDAKIKYANEGFANISGYSVDELIGKGIDKLVAPEDLAMVADRYVRRMKGEQVPSEYEFKLVKKDGVTRVDVIMDVGVITYEGGPAAMGIGKDITERKRMEDALRASEERYRLLADNASDVIMLMDMNARAVYFSPSVTRLLGYSVEEALAGSMEGRMTPASMEKAVKHFMAGLQREKRKPGGSSGQTLELEMIHKNGSIVIVEMMISFIRDENGKPTGMMAILRNVTERRKAEAEIVALSNAFKAAHDPIIIFNIQGNVVNANEAARQLFERDDVGVNALETVAQEDRDMVAAVLQDLISTGEPAAAQFNIVTRSGRRVPVEASGSVIRGADGMPVGIVVVERDLSERRQAESRQKLAAEILGILNEPLALPDAINRILAAIKRETGFYAVGIRLKKGEDFPYFVQSGFSEDFLLTENTLVVRDNHGDVCRDKDGNVSLECTCGLVLSGKTDPSNPLFTPGGSAWTNDSPVLLDVPLDQDPRLHPRNRCIHAGFQSVALMPIRSGNNIVGLLQLNDRRKGCFTLDIIRFFEGIAASIGVALMRKQTEDELSVSEVRYRRLFESAKDGILILDAETGMIVDVNPFLIEMLGYSHEQFIGKRVWELGPLKDIIPNRDNFLELQRQEYIRYEDLPLETVDGQRVDVEFVSNVYPVDHKKVIQCNIRDITERKKAQDALKESEKRYRLLAENATDVIAIVGMDRRLTYISPSITRLLGYTVEEALAHTMEEIYTPESVAKAVQLFTGELATEQMGQVDPEHTRTIELELYHKKGSVVPVEANFRFMRDEAGKPVAMLAMVRDITERKRMDATLQESEKKMRSLFEVSPDIIMIIDRQGKILFINRATTRAIEETIGTSVYDYIPTEYQSLYADTVENVFRTGKPDRIETKGLGSGRRMSWYEARFVLLKSDGEQQTLMVVATDTTERKEAGEALKESEEKFRTAFDSANTGICLVSLSGNLLKVNNKMSEMLGYSVAELERMTVNSIAHPDDLDVSPQFMNKALDGEIKGSVFEKRYFNKEGKTVWGLVSSALLHDADGEPLYFISQVQDITERKRAEEALRESELKYRSLVEQSLLGIVMIQDGRVVYINRMMEERGGYTLGELVSMPPERLKELIHSDDRDIVWNRMLNRLGGQKEAERNECRFIAKDGSAYWADVHTSIVEYLGKPALQMFLVDITDRKKAEEALSESEERLRVTLEVTQIGVWEWNVKDDTWYASPTYYTMLGYEPVIGPSDRKVWLTRGHPDDTEMVTSKIKDILNGVTDNYSYEARIKHADGSYRWNRVIGHTIEADAEGKPIRLAGIRVDVTERKEAEEALIRVSKAVESSSDAIGMSDPQGHHFYHNKAFTELFEYTPEELHAAGDGLAAFANRDIARKVFDTIMGGGSWNGEVEMVSKSGRRFTVLERADAIKDESGKVIGLVGVHTDITQRKEAEEALKASELKYKDLFEHTLLGMEVIDGATGKIVLANHSIARMFGFKSPEDMIGIDAIKEHVLKEDMDWVLQMFSQSLADPTRHEIATLRAKTVDGRIIWVTGSATSYIYEGKLAVLISLIDMTAVKEAEHKLKETEERIKSIVTTSQEWIWAIDSKGNHTFCNPAIEDILGYSPDEIIGRNADDLLYEDDIPLVRQVTARCVELKAGWSSLVLRWKHRGGGYRYLESNAVPILDGSGNLIGFQGSDRDITVRKQAEDQLRETRDYMENLIEHANVPMVVWNPGFRITRFNRAFERLTGMKAKSVIGKDLEILFPKGTRDRSMSFIRTAMQGARWEVVEIPIANVDGDVRTVLWNISPIYAEDGKTPIAIIAQGQDITERKKAEEALRESEEMARSMLDNAAMGIYLLQDSKFLYVNPTFEKILGYNSEELVGKEALNYVHLNDRGIVRIRAIENLKGISTQPYEFRALKKDGQQIWVMERVTSIRYKGKRAVIASFMETTEHRKSEEKLEQAYEELKTAHDRMVQSEKLRAMGEMASGIAHDFNNMLAVILGRTQLAIDDVKDDKVRKDIQIIEQAALDAAKTVKRLQDFARIRVEHPFELLDVNEIIEGVLKMVETRRVEMEQTKSIGIKVEHVLGKVGHVSGDAAELREALLNILFNALDAMPTGGRLTLKSEQDEDWVQISIKDTGVGIPDKVKSKIFQPFFTTKASKGSGLGLSVTYGIIARHGGMIKFDSEVGKGTTFSIKLPLAAEAAKQEAKKRKTAAAKPANILTVDDEPEVLKALDLTLEYFGHWVKGVTSGADAVKAFKDGNYDLVITDLGMPGMSGWDVARAIKKLKPDIPVLLITGWVIDLDEEQKKLVDGVIAKPFSRDSISSAVSQVFQAKKKRVVKKRAVKKSTKKKSN